MDEQGLHIKHITEDDNGLYICRASVVSLGSLKTRQITVDVYSKSIFLYLTNFPPFPPLFPFSLVLFVFSPSRHSSYRCLSYPCVPLAEFSRSRKFVDKKKTKQKDNNARLSYVDEGLMIKRFTEEDNGNYECRVAVKSTGSLKKREILVEAFSKIKNSN